MLLTVLNDLRERVTMGHWLASYAPGWPAQWGGLGQSPYCPGRELLEQPSVNPKWACANSPATQPNPKWKRNAPEPRLYLCSAQAQFDPGGQHRAWHPMASRARFLAHTSPLPWGALTGTHLPCYWHSVEDVPQHNPHDHLVPEVEDDTFAVVLPLGRGLGDCRIAGRNGDFWGLRLCLTLWADTSTCGQPPEKTKSKQNRVRKF